VGGHLKVPNGVSRDDVDRWLQQVEPADRWVFERLLEYARFYGADQVVALVQSLHRQLKGTYGVALETALYAPCGYVASSGAAVCYLYRRANRLPESQFIALDDVSGRVVADQVVVFLDDFLGSGQSAIRLWHDIAARLENPRKAKPVLACTVGYEQAITAIQFRTSFRVVCAEVIPISEQPFSGTSVVFPKAGERDAAREVVERYSSRLGAQGALGYADVQGLISFFFNTPDNTLPIFWSTAEDWRPLFPFGATTQTYSEALRGGRGPILPQITRSSSFALDEIDGLREADIDAELAIVVLHEFQSVAALAALTPALSALRIPTDKMRAMIKAIQKLRHAVHEQHPIQTALLVVPGTCFRERGVSPFVVPESALHVNDTSELQALAELVNGFEGAVVLQSDGVVVGNVMYDDPGGAERVLPRRLYAAAATSDALEALLLVFAGDGRVSVLYGGHRLLTHRRATWHVPPMRIREQLDRLEREAGIDPGVALSVYQIALDMSDLGEGAILLIGSDGEIAALSDPRPTPWKWQSLDTTLRCRREVIALAKQDGATLISPSGRVVRSGLMLRPPANVLAAVDSNAGARHSSAAKTTVVSSSTAFVVSVDGMITVFRSGKPVLRDMT